MLVLGDRYETLAACLQATIQTVPIAHIHGGESTYGSFDNQIRDAITKLAHVHFPAARPFAERLHDLGENPDRIHVVGAPGLDNLVDLPPRVPEKYFVCTYHPATLEKETGIYELIKALDKFPDYKQIWTGVNNDPGNHEIEAALAGRDVRSLNPREYILLCRNAAAVVGNSSSGIIEAPYLEVPSVNVGHRQRGRLSAPSVYQTGLGGCNFVAGMITDILDYPGLFESFYGSPGASRKIADILADIDLENILIKEH
jgi:UDP-hydrolysing UDP-N-acetyl-D-glucosamine 2-epimerase